MNIGYVFYKVGKEIARPFKKIYNKLYKKIGIFFGFIEKPKKTRMTDFEVENDRALFNSLNKDKDFIISKEFDYICKTEKYTNNAGSIDDEIGYFVQDIWGARKVYKERMRRFFDSLESGPKDSIESSLRQSSQKLKSFIHYDVGSRVDGFIAHLLTFNQNVCLIDIRPMSSMESNFLTNGGGG